MSDQNLWTQIQLQSPGKVLDFGPPLGYPQICAAYTVEKLSLWQHMDGDHFEMVAVRAAFLAKARAEGHLYNLTNEQLIQLDKIRGHGVHCERKLLPIYVPLRTDRGEMTKAMAWVYIGYKSHWVDKIEYGANFDKPTFKPLPRVPDQDKYLHNRVCFLPPVYQFNEGPITEAMRIKVRKKNKETSRNLFFSRMRRFLNADGDEPRAQGNTLDTELLALRQMKEYKEMNG